MQKPGYVHIVTNKHRTTLYIGVTSDLPGRIYKHKSHFYKYSFSDKYNLEYIVYYEYHGDIEYALAREKELKKWNRQKKETLINSINPEWKDLWDEMNR